MKNPDSGNPESGERTPIQKESQPEELRPGFRGLVGVHGLATRIRIFEGLMDLDEMATQVEDQRTIVGAQGRDGNETHDVDRFGSRDEEPNILYEYISLISGGYVEV